MNDFIINVPPSRDANIWFGPPWDAFLPPLAGSLIGVLIAYLLAKGTERYLNVQKRAKWLEMIRKELIRAHSELKENEKSVGIFFAIHNESLKSLVSSGDLSLFAANEAIALTLIYTRIDNYGKNIERINKRIERLKYHVNPENFSYRSLLNKLDELQEKQMSGDKSPEIKDRINKVNDEISALNTYSEVNIDTESYFGIEYGRRMRRIIEAILEKEWFKDEEKHYLFPKHMSKSDEEMLEGLTKLPLVPGSA
jgi:hypothetical protein